MLYTFLHGNPAQDDAGADEGFSHLPRCSDIWETFDLI